MVYHMKVYGESSERRKENHRAHVVGDASGRASVNNGIMALYHERGVI